MSSDRGLEVDDLVALQVSNICQRSQLIKGYADTMAIILAVNAGSSSVKVSVYNTQKAGQPPTQIAEAEIAGLTAPPVSLTYKKGSKQSNDEGLEDIKGQEDAFEYVLKYLVDDESLHEIKTKDDIGYTCHRVVHGGDYPAAHVIDSDTYHHLEDLTDLAPLHNASALAIVKFCSETLPKAKNIAFFDSSFHATIPQAISTYPIDQKIASKNSLRKYGFHGISYAFITRSVAEFLGKSQDETNIIALHLGSGASACAIQNGKSLDTTMGLTPLDGLPGATRSGSVDPRLASSLLWQSLTRKKLINGSLIFHFTHDAGKPSPSSTKELHISTVGPPVVNPNGRKL